MDKLFFKVIAGPLEVDRTTLIIVISVALGLFLLVLGELERLTMIQEWDRSRFLSLLKEQQKRLDEMASSVMEKTPTTLDIPATDVSSSQRPQD